MLSAGSTQFCLSSSQLFAYACLRRSCSPALVQHGFNAALILGEAFLNSLPIFAYLMGYVGLWSSLYGIWAQLHYLRTGRFLYPVSCCAFLLWTRVARCLRHLG